MATQKELRRSGYSFSGNHAARTFIWVVTISRIPDRQTKNLASRAQILANRASQRAVKSRFPSRYFNFSRNPHCILVKSRILRIPFQTLYRLYRPCTLNTFFSYLSKSTNNLDIEMIDSLDCRHPLESSLCLYTRANSPSVFTMAFHPRQNSWFVFEVHHMNFTFKLKLLYCYLVFYMLHQGFNMHILYLSFKLYIRDYL